MDRLLQLAYVVWYRVRKFIGFPLRISHYGRCPSCGTSFDGGPIPDNIREHYAPPYKWSRVIGIELPYDHPQHYDGVSFWQCPDCQFTWPRFLRSLR